MPSELRGGAPVFAPKDYAYGMRDFDAVDLDGKQLCFGMQSKH
jgi:hypothetical protein